MIFMPRIVHKALSFSFARYLISGGTAASVNFAALFLLVEVVHVHYLFASAISVGMAIIVSFTLHKFFTFREHTLERIPHQFVRYLLLLACSVSVNTVLMWLLVDGLLIPYFLAQVAVSGVIATGNFFAYRLFVFHFTPHRTDTPEADTSRGILR